MRCVLVILVVTALAGCGGSEAPQPAAGAGANPVPKGDFGPVQRGSGERARPVAPPRRPPSSSIASALAGGTVGVVGVEGEVGIRPRRLLVAANGAITGLQWERWGDVDALGSGTLAVPDCDPTCASGGMDRRHATVRLSSPRLCGGATYFDRARVELDGAPGAGGAGGDPLSYVRAPC
jgi:hypothetical protein